ncbi:MAG: hypothetical protein V3W20_00560 [Candidatus Neomarinimicrobiota bacterium]
MKDKIFLQCKVTSKTGRVFNNPLKLSEVRFVSQLAQENMQVVVWIVTVTPKTYKATFG